MKPRVLIAEFVGTFALVFVTLLAAANMGNDPSVLVAIALAYGLTVSAMVWATAPISGGHLNPAVSLAQLVAGRLSGIHFVGYLVAQFLGAFLAALLIISAVPLSMSAFDSAAPHLGDNVQLSSGMLLEAVATFCIAFVALLTETRRLGRLSALFVGLAVAGAVFAIYPYTGAALNPFRYLGPALASQNYNDLLVYLLGPTIGATAAAVLLRTQMFQEDEEEVEEMQPAPTDTSSLGETTSDVIEPEPVISPEPARYLTSTLYEQGQSTQYVPVGATSPTFTEPGLQPDGRLNFSSIYRMANLPDVAFTAEQVLEMVESLPGDLPIESKRAAIRVTIQTMARTTGASIETVIADARRKVQALASFAESYTEQANQYILKTQHEMETMEAEIERRQRGIEEATTKQTQMVEACQYEADRIEKVFDFFEDSRQ